MPPRATTSTNARCESSSVRIKDAESSNEKPATPTIEEQKAAHEAIDALVAVHVDKIEETSPSEGLLEQLAFARADGSPRCKCAVYKHLFVKKT